MEEKTNSELNKKSFFNAVKDGDLKFADEGVVESSEIQNPNMVDKMAQIILNDSVTSNNGSNESIDSGQEKGFHR